MPRKKRPLDRDGGVLRDASLIVIASEDTYAVKDYFRRFKTRKVQFLVVQTERGRSAPSAVVARLDDFRRENPTQPGDQFWFCIDKDHWANSGHIDNLVQVLQLCRQKEYQIAISNPCFEIWLLLHFEDVTSTTATTCRGICERLSEVAGGYDKTNCDRLPLATTMVRTAVERARTLDTNKSLIPDSLLTRVYQIIEVLQTRDAIDLE